MAEEIPQSHIKLATTVTAGAGGEHSPYYRRMLSAGYKGLIQGTIGGATLYGMFGVGIGAIVGVATLPFWGPSALLAVPLLGAAGLMKGAGTFGEIGATAAIYAEGAEMNERRRALLDRLSETKSQAEADEILNLLHEEGKEKAPPNMFHWKTVLIGAALGATCTALLLLVPGGGALHFIVEPIAEALVGAGMGEAALATAGGIVAALGTGIGALAGATIGIDRYYVRKWFDVSEDLVHDPEKAESAALSRQREANRLHAISKTDTQEIIQAPIDNRSVAPIQTSQVHRYEDTPRPRVRVDSVGAQREALMTPEEAMKIEV